MAGAQIPKISVLPCSACAYTLGNGGTEMVEEQKRTAAFLPWATFTNALDQLSKGMPSRIDRTVFPGMAWNAQSQLFAALKFFGLLKDEDEPTPALHDLVTGDEADRAVKLKKAVEAAYADLIAIDLTKATKGHFDEELGRLYNVTGDTRVKAARFFLSAAKQVGIPLSGFILPKDGKAKRAKSSSPRARVATKAKKTLQPPPSFQPTGGKPSGESKVISLVSGGTLTLSASFDFFSLSPADRTFVFSLIEKLEKYESEV